MLCTFSTAGIYIVATNPFQSLVLQDVLAENGRLRYTPAVISAFGKIMSAYRGEVLCSVTTAQVGFMA